MKKILVTLLAFVSLSAFAELKQDGNEMLKHMSKNDASYSEGVMLGYIRGIADNMHCIPGEVTNGQTFDVVKKYLEQNPELRHQYMGVLVAKALNKAYPCKKTAPKG